jgi:DNA-binding beta-propeller fold protein YncE
LQVHNIQFTPDGKNLLLECQDSEGRRLLRRVKLKLSAAETAAAEKPLPAQPLEKPKVAPAPKGGLPRV